MLIQIQIKIGNLIFDFFLSIYIIIIIIRRNHIQFASKYPNLIQWNSKLSFHFNFKYIIHYSLLETTNTEGRKEQVNGYG